MEKEIKLEVTMLSKPDENPARVGINGDIVLILDSDNDDFKMDAEYDEAKYTQDEVQDLANKFMEGLMNSIKSGDLFTEDV